MVGRRRTLSVVNGSVGRGRCGSVFEPRNNAPRRGTGSRPGDGHRPPVRRGSRTGHRYEPARDRGTRGDGAGRRGRTRARVGATGRAPQRRRARGAPLASHGPDGSIPGWAARPLTRQATSGSWERGATSLCHEHRRSRGRRTRAPHLPPAASSHSTDAESGHRAFTGMV